MKTTSKGRTVFLKKSVQTMKESVAFTSVKGNRMPTPDNTLIDITEHICRQTLHYMKCKAKNVCNSEMQFK